MIAYPGTYCREEARRFFLDYMREGDGGAEGTLERIGSINNAGADLAVLERDMNAFQE